MQAPAPTGTIQEDTLHLRHHQVQMNAGVFRTAKGALLILAEATVTQMKEDRAPGVNDTVHHRKVQGLNRSAVTTDITALPASHLIITVSLLNNVLSHLITAHRPGVILLLRVAAVVLVVVAVGVALVAAEAVAVVSVVEAGADNTVIQKIYKHICGTGTFSCAALFLT